VRKFGFIKFQSKTVKNTKNMSKNCAFLFALTTFFKLIQNWQENLKKLFRSFYQKNPFGLEFQIFGSFPGKNMSTF